MANEPSPADNGATEAGDGELRVLLCTCPERDSLRLAHALVEERKAACVNIVPQITSVYRWEGAVAEDREALLVIKTRAPHVGDATRLIKELHSYSVPEVIALRLADGEGNPDYLAWLRASVGPEKP